jgi:CRISPR-associated endonuclease/helicase Cas3
MSTSLPPIAHRRDSDPHFHDLGEHLVASSHLAACFAETWGAGETARLAGLWHDLGKYSTAFQKRIRGETEAHIRVTHAFAGAQLALEQLGKAGRPLAYAIAGHHAGLQDWKGEDDEGGLEKKLAAPSHLRQARANHPPDPLMAAPTKLPPLPPEVDASVWIRMLASAVFDADFLDSEAFFDQGRSWGRKGWPNLTELLPRFESEVTQRFAKATPSPVDGLRTEVLAACRAAAAQPQGRFSLTVPTGGGKTLSSLAFALHHAQAHGLRRIIYAVPFTSIIEQTAQVFREVLGQDAVLEHHSALEPGCETARSRLAAENWDAPVIVTTTVQLFESLFARRTSQIRKLHNLAASVLVLDEAQALPVGVLRPVTAVLDQLARHYRVSVVLCTATQPALKSVFRDFQPVTEIAPDPPRLFKSLDRVSVEMVWGDDQFCTVDKMGYGAGNPTPGRD